MKKLEFSVVVIRKDYIWTRKKLRFAHARDAFANLTECAERSERVDNVTIDHNNWEHAVDVFAQEARARWMR